MHCLDTGRVVIVGAGLAALSTALWLAPRPVIVISPEPLGLGASSAWAQGGIAAAMDPADSADAHAGDTIRAGAGTVDAAVAHLVAAEAAAQIRRLSDLGTPFDRAPSGGYVMSREAAHGFPRVVRVGGDQAGAAIMRTLIDTVRKTPSIQVIEGYIATGLDQNAGDAECQLVGGRVTGVQIMRALGSAALSIRCPAVVLAGGGSGGLYALTTNPPRIAGQVIGMAARAGARIADAEFVQFHPTAIDAGSDPAPLATEALRGEGAHLVNAQGERFMLAVHADAELAPRDIVARAIYAQTQAGLRPALDTRACLGPAILTRFPIVAAACARAGIDPVTDTIPVAAAAHYHMGGIATDAHGRSSLPGLWACGEASSTGLHGANRLASNGLLEALVFSRRVAADLPVPDAIADDDAPAITLPQTPDCANATPDPALVQRLRRAMTDGAGVIRDGDGLTRCLQQIARIEAAQPGCPALMNMTATATLIAAAALSRRESRGAHFRSDFPQTDTTARRSSMTLTDALALRAVQRPTLEETR